MSSRQGMSEQTGTGGLLNPFVEHHVYRVSRLITLVGQEQKRNCRAYWSPIHEPSPNSEFRNLLKSNDFDLTVISVHTRQIDNNSYITNYKSKTNVILGPPRSQGKHI